MKNENQRSKPAVHDTEREGRDEALTNLEQNQPSQSIQQNVGYTNEERIAGEGEGRNKPGQDDDPAGSGIASKE